MYICPIKVVQLGFDNNHQSSLNPTAFISQPNKAYEKVLGIGSICNSVTVRPMNNGLDSLKWQGFRASHIFIKIACERGAIQYFTKINISIPSEGSEALW